MRYFEDAIDLAGGMTRVSVGLEEMMAPEFVFCSPAIGPISKIDFINLMKYYRYNGLDLASAIPDLTACAAIHARIPSFNKIFFV